MPRIWNRVARNQFDNLLQEHRFVTITLRHKRYKQKYLLLLLMAIHSFKHISMAANLFSFRFIERVSFACCMGVKDRKYFHIPNSAVEFSSVHTALPPLSVAIWCFGISEFSKCFALGALLFVCGGVLLIGRQTGGKERCYCQRKCRSHFYSISLPLSLSQSLSFWTRWARWHCIWISHNTHLFDFRKAEIVFDTRTKFKWKYVHLSRRDEVIVCVCACARMRMWNRISGRKLFQPICRVEFHLF